MGLTHFSLFTGIGGIDLSAEWAGFQTIGQCEYADYPTKVLEKHWTDVPRWKDVRDVTRYSIRQRGVDPDRITLLSGGFPCQPHSLAGKRKASADDRDLWGEFARVICETRPRWVLGENVFGLLSSENGRFFGRVLRDLAEMGYRVGWACYGACDVGANHRRERVFIVAHADGDHRRPRRAEPAGQQRQTGATDGGDDVAGTYDAGLQVPGHQPKLEEIPAKHRIEYGGCDVPNPDNGSRIMRRNGQFPAIAETERTWTDNRGRAPEYVAREWWAVEPDVGRVAHGVPARVDRLKCLGNAVVPQQVYPILKAIAMIEHESL
jgi:DNA (cytosine-5)-methyltransferase 1